MGATADTVEETYARRAAAFDAERCKRLFERPWLDRAAAPMRPPGAVLDVGCGSGDPIGRYFLEAGYAVTGVDVARPMIDIAAGRFPHGRWIHADMRALRLDEQFDLVVAWHSLFHLTPEDQRTTLPALCAHVRPGGALLMTVGPMPGETQGLVAGEPVYHASLSEAAYRSALEAQGLSIRAFEREDAACAGATVLLARRGKGPA